MLLPGKHQELEGLVYGVTKESDMTKQQQKDYNGKISVNSVLQGK